MTAMPPRGPDLGPLDLDALERLATRTILDQNSLDFVQNRHFDREGRFHDA